MEEARVCQEDREEGDLQRESIASEEGVEKAEESEGVDPQLDAVPVDLADAEDVMKGSQGVFFGAKCIVTSSYHGMIANVVKNEVVLLRCTVRVP